MSYNLKKYQVVKIMENREIPITEDESDMTTEYKGPFQIGFSCDDCLGNCRNWMVDEGYVGVLCTSLTFFLLSPEVKLLQIKR